MIDLKLLVADNCDHCAEAKMAVNEATKDIDSVNVETVNLSNDLPDYLYYKAAATPSVVINGKIEFVGKIDELELRKRLTELM